MLYLPVSDDSYSGTVKSHHCFQNVDFPHLLRFQDHVCRGVSTKIEGVKGAFMEGFHGDGDAEMGRGIG